MGRLSMTDCTYLPTLVRCRVHKRPSGRRLFRSQQGLGSLPGAHGSVRTVADVAWHLILCRGSLRVVRAVRVCGTRWPLLLGTCPCALVVAAGVSFWWPRGPAWCAAPRPVRSLWVLLSAVPSPWCHSQPGGCRPRIYWAGARDTWRPAEKRAHCAGRGPLPRQGRWARSVSYPCRAPRWGCPWWVPQASVLSCVRCGGFRVWTQSLTRPVTSVVRRGTRSVHWGCFVWTPTPPLAGPRTPRLVPVRVCVCSFFLAGSGAPARWARFGEPHLSCDRLNLLLCLAPSGLGLPLPVGLFAFFPYLFFLFSLRASAPPLFLAFSGCRPRVSWALALVAPSFPHPPCFSLFQPAWVGGCFPAALLFLRPPPLFFFRPGFRRRVVGSEFFFPLALLFLFPPVLFLACSGWCLFPTALLFLCPPPSFFCSVLVFVAACLVWCLFPLALLFPCSPPLPFFFSFPACLGWCLFPPALLFLCPPAPLFCFFFRPGFCCRLLGLVFVSSGRPFPLPPPPFFLGQLWLVFVFCRSLFPLPPPTPPLFPFFFRPGFRAACLVWCLFPLALLFLTPPPLLPGCVRSALCRLVSPRCAAVRSGGLRRRLVFCGAVLRCSVLRVLLWCPALLGCGLPWLFVRSVVLCHAVGWCCVFRRVFGRVVPLRCSPCGLLSCCGLRCCVLCRVPGCFAAPCCCALLRPALFCCALCPVLSLCLVLPRAVSCAWPLSVALGSCAFRRCVFCAVCVLACSAGACCCSLLCFVLCASWGVVLCIPCPLRPVWCCAALCWCGCGVLFVWSVLFLALGAAMRCCLLCGLLRCSAVMLRAVPRRPVARCVVLRPAAQVAGCRVVRCWLLCGPALPWRPAPLCCAPCCCSAVWCCGALSCCLVCFVACVGLLSPTLKTTAKFVNIFFQLLKIK